MESQHYTAIEASLKLALLCYVANRIVREYNPLLGRTYVYKYDSRGNILGKSEYNYTTASNLTATQNYTYNTYDRLTNWNGKTFEYDNCGNPTRYKGEAMSWERGRLLASYKNAIANLYFA